MGIQQFRNEYPQRFDTLKIAFMDVTSSTNSRTMISAVVPDFPCNHKVPTLTGASITHKKALVLNGVLNSYVYDALLRLRFELHIIWRYYLKTTNVYYWLLIL
jgi:hypothetical protein